MSLKTRIEALITAIGTEAKSIKSKISGNISGDLSGLNTTVKTSILAAVNEVNTGLAGKQNSLGYTAENTTNKGAAGGYAPLDSNAKVPAANLPGFVDDIVMGTLTNSTTFTAAGNDNVANGVVVPNSSTIYVDTTTNLQYRWSGAAYVSMNASLALGTTSTTAFRGDYGQIAYTHSQIADGSNPHATTFTNLAGKPTTIAGFGITDAYTKTEIGDPETDFAAAFAAALN